MAAKNSSVEKTKSAYWTIVNHAGTHGTRHPHKREKTDNTGVLLAIKIANARNRASELSEWQQSLRQSTLRIAYLLSVFHSRVRVKKKDVNSTIFIACHIVVEWSPDS